MGILLWASHRGCCHNRGFWYMPDCCLSIAAVVAQRCSRDGSGQSAALKPLAEHGLMARVWRADNLYSILGQGPVGFVSHGFCRKFLLAFLCSQ